jgi:hypothetical protein
MTEATDKPDSDLLGITTGANGMACKGRPTGSVNIASRKASKKLEALGFDPIEEMVKLFHKLGDDIYKVQYDEDGLPREKFSALALANLMSAQQRCIDTLMRYGYARTTEGVEVTTNQLMPVTIQLAGSAKDFDTNVLGVDREDTYKGDNE